VYWAKAFKGEEETNDFERGFIIRLRISPVLTIITKAAQESGSPGAHRRSAGAAQWQAELRRAGGHGQRAVG
jgi:hypothetical protein